MIRKHGAHLEPCVCVGKPLGIEPIAIMLRTDVPAFKSAVDGYLLDSADL